MIFEDIGLRLDEEELKRAYREAREAGTEGDFFEGPLGRFFEMSGEVGAEMLERLAMPLSEIGLQVKTLNCLTRANPFRFVWQIAGKTDAQLLRMKNLGKDAAFPDIKEALGRLGIYQPLVRWNKALVARAQAQTDPDWAEEAAYKALRRK